MTERGWARLAAVAGVPVLVLVILLTQSRGVMLGLCVGGIYFLIVSQYRLRVILFIGAAVTIAALWSPQGAWDRFEGLSKASIHDMSAVDPEQSASSRWTIMRIGLNIVADHPVAGVGIGNYELFHFQRTVNDPTISVHARGYRDTHNAYIRAAAEAGIPGAVGFVAFILVSVLTVRRSRQHHASQPECHMKALSLLALEVSMISFAVASGFGSVERTTFAMLQFLLPSVIAVVMAQGSNGASCRSLIAPSRRRIGVTAAARPGRAPGRPRRS
jgi:O-antigen ligase